jgi:hypothetical protein
VNAFFNGVDNGAVSFPAERLEGLPRGGPHFEDIAFCDMPSVLEILRFNLSLVGRRAQQPGGPQRRFRNSAGHRLIEFMESHTPEHAVTKNRPERDPSSNRIISG